ncbi:MAG: flavodoxin family protein [Planctomycetota bacterium]
MKILMISGSRNPRGKTARCALAVLEGAKKAGATVENAYLPSLTLERCRQCDEDGWGPCRREGRCVIEDDFAGLVERIGRADAVVFANPVYFGDLSESLRAFTDRLRRVSRFGEGRAECNGKPVVGVCAAGGGGGGAYSSCASLYNVLERCGFDVADMIPVRRQNLEAKLAALGLAGEWLATSPRSE